MKSVEWKEGDTVVITNTAYDCINKVVDYLTEKYNIETLLVSLW